jgi:hypothetical protein
MLDLLPLSISTQVGSTDVLSFGYSAFRGAVIVLGKSAEMRNCINEPTDRRKIKAFFERQAKNEATASIASGYSKLPREGPRTARIRIEERKNKPTSAGARYGVFTKRSQMIEEIAVLFQNAELLIEVI